MNFTGYLMITLGLTIFLIGYWFLALSNGQKECGDSTIVSKSSTNMTGGIAGIVIGLIIMILGIVFGHSAEIPIESPSE
jgi:uncharacterized membrane protein